MQTDRSSENTGHERDRNGSDRKPERSKATSTGRDTPDNRPSRTYLRVLDALVYAITAALALVVGSTLASFAVGGGWGGVKYSLFIVGFFLFGVSAFGFRPAGAWTESSASSPTHEETRFQAVVQATPPLRRYDLVPDERLPVAAKLFVTSVLVLGVSFVMERVFGVAA